MLLCHPQIKLLQTELTNVRQMMKKSAEFYEVPELC